MSARARNTAALFALAFALAACACGRGAANTNTQANVNAAASPASTPAAADANSQTDLAKLDAEVEQAEKRAERNPGDDDALVDLAKAYVRRGNALRASNQLKEALLDYRRAQSADPDNPDAQRNAAEIAPLVEGAQTGQIGEPAPLPITPSVSDEDAKPTPKKQ